MRSHPQPRVMTIDGGTGINQQEFMVLCRIVI